MIRDAASREISRRAATHGSLERTIHMNVVDWLAGHFSNRGKAMTLYRRGMAKAKKRNHRGAIDDYSKTLGMPDTPNDVKAMVLYNRAQGGETCSF